MSTASGIKINRSTIYRALERRNRSVSWLRIGVPVFGILVLIALLAQLMAANIANQFLPEGVRVERDNVMIDAPTYSGVMRDGTRYTIVSDAAEAALQQPDIIELSAARIELYRPTGQEIVAEAEQAVFSFSNQRVNVGGALHATENGGATAQLQDSVFDLTAQTMDTRGNVEVVFADGSILTAGTLHFDAAVRQWDFRLVKITVPGEQDK